MNDSALEQHKPLPYRRARLLIELPFWLVFFAVLEEVFVSKYGEYIGMGILVFAIYYLVAGFIFCLAVHHRHEKRCFKNYFLSLAAMAIVISGGLG